MCVHIWIIFVCVLEREREGEREGKEREERRGEERRWGEREREREGAGIRSYYSGCFPFTNHFLVDERQSILNSPINQ